MVMHDLNSKEEKSVLMIHPMLSSAEGFQICLTPYLGNGYRYLMPDLNGHGDAVDKTYVDAESEAKEIHDYLLKHDCLNFQLAYCASLGGAVMLKLLQYNDIRFEHIFFEGASLYEKADFLETILTSIFLHKHKVAKKNPALSIKKMSSIYGEIAGEAMAKRFISISDESIRHIFHDCSHVDLIPLNKEIQKKCVFAYGEGDMDLAKAKKQLPKHYPHASLIIWPHFGHCERISKDSEAYAEMLKSYL